MNGEQIQAGRRRMARVPSWARRTGSLLYRSSQDFFNDNGVQWAAAIAYYALLSLFPMFLAILSAAAFIVDPRWASDQLSEVLTNVLPGVQWGESVEGVVKAALAGRGAVGVFSILALLWAGSRVFGTLTQALNIAFNADETYSFWARTLIQLVMTVTIGAVFVLALAARPLIDLLWNALGVVPEGRGFVFRAVTQGLSLLVMAVAFFLVYRFVPRRPVNWRASLPSALLATAAYALARPIFFFVVEYVASYNVVYGSMVVVVVLMVWAWVVALLTLFCGEIASHIQAMWIEGRPGREVERLHVVEPPARKNRPGS